MREIHGKEEGLLVSRGAGRDPSRVQSPVTSPQWSAVTRTSLRHGPATEPSIQLVNGMVAYRLRDDFILLSQWALLLYESAYLLRYAQTVNVVT